MQNKTKWHGLTAGIAHKNIYKPLHSVEKMIEAIVNLRSKKISRTKKQSKKNQHTSNLQTFDALKEELANFAFPTFWPMEFLFSSC